MSDAREQLHALGRLTLDVSCPSPDDVPSLWDRLGALSHGRLAQVIDEVFSRHAVPAEVVRLDELSIDLGRVRESHLEEDFVEAVRRELERALAALFAADPGHGRPTGTGAPGDLAIARLSGDERRVELLRELLVAGSPPWWAAAAEPRELRLVFDELRQVAPGALAAVLRDTGRQARVRRRLVLQFDDAGLQDVVRLLEPAYAPAIGDYVEELEREHARRVLVAATAAEFRGSVWEVVLAYLLVEAGSRFNERMFLRSTIHGIAARHRVRYDELLAQLRDALALAGFADTRHTFATVIEELWRGLPGGARSDTGRRRADLAQDAAAPHGRAEHAASPASRDRPDLLDGEDRDRDATRLTASAIVPDPRRSSDSARLEEAVSPPDLGANGGAAPVGATGGAELDAELEWVEALAAQLPRGAPEEEAARRADRALQRLARARPSSLRGLLFRKRTGRYLVRWLSERSAEVLEEVVSAVASRRLARETAAFTRFLDTVRPPLTGDPGKARTLRRTAWKLALESHRPQARTSGASSSVVRETIARAAAELGRSYDGLLQQLWHAALRSRANADAASVAPHLRDLLRVQRRRKGAAVPPDGIRDRPDASQRAPHSEHASARLVESAPPGRRSGAETPGGPERSLERAVQRAPERVARWLRAARNPTALLERVARETREGSRRVLLVELLPREQRGVVTSSVDAFAAILARQGLGDLVKHLRVQAIRLVLEGRRREPLALVRAVLDAWTAKAGRPWQPLLARGASARARTVPSTAIGRVLSALAHESGAGEHGSASARELDPAERLERVFLVGRDPQAPAVRPTPPAMHALVLEAERAVPGGRRRRLALMLHGAGERTRALATLEDRSLARLAAWLSPSLGAAAAEALANLDDVLRSSQLSLSMRDTLRRAFWESVWLAGRQAESRVDAVLARLAARLARREPRLLVALSSLPSRSTLVGLARRFLEHGETALQARPALPEANARRPERPPASPRPLQERQHVTSTAGLVLLAPFLPAYFDRCGLALRQDDEARAITDREQAVAFAHFLATGRTTFAEADLVLEKLLCGLTPEHPVPTRLEVTDELRERAEGLLSFLLQHWPATIARNMSADGLRGAFLCRPGRLEEGFEQWLLEVDRQLWDAFLESWPWSASVVKLAWMSFPIYVRWTK